MDNDERTYTPEDNPTLTFQVANGRIRNKCDEEIAMRQAVDKILETERFVYPIYTDQYGNDLYDLIGKSFSYAKVEVERMIKEALLEDDRVTSVTIDEIKQTSATHLYVHGSCTTVYGDLPVETEVRLNDAQ